jgi:hypothetical protein
LRLLEASDGGRNSRDEERTILDGTQIYEVHWAAEVGLQSTCDGNGYGGFTNPAWSNNADEAPRSNVCPQSFYCLITPHHSPQALGQVRRCGAFHRASHKRAALTRALDGSYKAIPLGRHVSNIPRAVSTITDRFTESSDLNPKAGALNEDIRPAPFNKVPMTDDLSRSLDQSDQNIEGTAAQRDWRGSVQQQSLGHY